jgi:hypothetical protein
MRPWLLFIIRESRTNPLLLEFCPTHEVWMSDSPNAVSGKLRPDFVARLAAANDQVNLDVSTLSAKIAKVRPRLEVHRPRFPSMAQA